MSGWRLVSDVGGTNVRFAKAPSANEVFEIRAYPVSRFPSFLSAARAYFDETGGLDGCAAVAIGAAGVVANGKVRLTNASWEVSEKEVSSEFGVPCRLVNDVEAVAYSLPALPGSALAALGPPMPNLAIVERALVANIGTGFGAATLFRTGGGWASCPSEAGHMTLTFPDWETKALERQFHSVEDVLSGQGLCNLHAAIWNTTLPTPAGIFERAKDNADAAATVKLFTQIAGNVLSNLALAVAAWDGVFLCGSVALGLSRIMDHATLRQAFERGRMGSRLKRVPIAVLTPEYPAFIGLAVLPMPTAR